MHEPSKPCNISHEAPATPRFLFLTPSSSPQSIPRASASSLLTFACHVVAPPPSSLPTNLPCALSGLVNGLPAPNPQLSCCLSVATGVFSSESSSSSKIVSPTTPPAPPETLPAGVGAEYKILGGVAGGTGRENELKRAFVSRIWTGSRPVTALGYLLGGGALRG